MCANGAGAGVGVHVGAHAGINVAAVIMAKSTAVLRSIAADAVDAGFLRQDHGPETCTKCGKPCEGDTCQYCSAIRGEENALENRDIDEFEDGSESRVRNEEYGSEVFGEILTAVDLASRFEELLVENRVDVNTAKQCGQVLALIWESVRPTDQDGLKEAIENLMITDNIKQILIKSPILDLILQEFESIADEQAESKASTLFPEMTIFKNESGTWVTAVDDPFRNLLANIPTWSVPIGHGARYSGTKLLEVMKHRYDNLLKLGSLLIERRMDYFNAPTSENAEQLLIKTPLTQKKMAEELDVSRATMSLWCNGIWVATPHGHIPLGHLFKRAAATKIGKDLTREAVLNEVRAAKKLYPGRKQNANILSELKKRGIEMSIRTLGDYLQSKKRT